MDTFLIIVSLVTGVSSLLSIVIKLYISISNVENKINKWENTLSRNTLYILKLALFSEGLDLTDRIQAGQQYLELKHDLLVEKK